MCSFPSWKTNRRQSTGERASSWLFRSSVDILMEPGDSFQRKFQHFNAISIVFNEVRQDEPCQSQRSASLTLSVYTCILLIHGVLCTQRVAHLFRSLTQGLKTLLPIFNSISIFLELRPCPCVTTPRPRDVPAKKVGDKSQVTHWRARLQLTVQFFSCSTRWKSTRGIEIGLNAHLALRCAPQRRTTVLWTVCRACSNAASPGLSVAGV